MTARPPLDPALCGVQDVYLDHASLGPLPGPTVAALHQWAEDVRTSGRDGVEDWRARIEVTRAGAARLLGTRPERVAFTLDTTAGIGLLAGGLPWHPGDRVLVPAHEFPSNVYPWLALRSLGVEVVRVPAGPGQSIDLAAVATALAAGPVKAVAASWVQFALGARVDLAELAELAHRHGALLVADLAQGLGSLPCHFDDWALDAAVAPGHKWLLSPEGTGVLAISDDLRDRVAVRAPGWASAADVDYGQDSDRYRLHDDARRFEPGSYNVSGLAALGTSVDLLLEAGPEHIWTHIDALCAHAVQAVTAIPHCEVRSDRAAGRGSGIVTVSVRGVDAESVAVHLRAQGVQVTARGGGVRLSPHGWTSIDAIDHAVEALASVPV